MTAFRILDRVRIIGGFEDGFTGRVSRVVSGRPTIYTVRLDDAAQNPAGHHSIGGLTAARLDWIETPAPERDVRPGDRLQITVEDPESGGTTQLNLEVLSGTDDGVIEALVSASPYIELTQHKRYINWVWREVKP